MIVSHIWYNCRNFSLANHRKLVSLELIAALRHFALLWAFSLYVECINIWSANNDYLECAYCCYSWEIRIRCEVFRPYQIPFFILSPKEFVRIKYFYASFSIKDVDMILESTSNTIFSCKVQIWRTGPLVCLRIITVHWQRILAPTDKDSLISEVN